MLGFSWRELPALGRMVSKLYVSGSELFGVCSQREQLLLRLSHPRSHWQTLGTFSGDIKAVYKVAEQLAVAEIFTSPSLLAVSFFRQGVWERVYTVQHCIHCFLLSSGLLIWTRRLVATEIPHVSSEEGFPSLWLLKSFDEPLVEVGVEDATGEQPARSVNDLIQNPLCVATGGTRLYELGGWFHEFGDPPIISGFQLKTMGSHLKLVKQWTRKDIAGLPVAWTGCSQGLVVLLCTHRLSSGPLPLPQNLESNNPGIAQLQFFKLVRINEDEEQELPCPIVCDTSDFDEHLHNMGTYKWKLNNGYTLAHACGKGCCVA